MFLWIRLPGGKSLQVALPDKPGLTIGSSLDCDIPIRARFVSRKHLEIAREPGRVRFKDLGSSNGTLLNGVRTEGGLLNAGDVLTVGEAALQLAESGTERPSLSEPAPGVRVTTLAEIGEASLSARSEGGESRLFGLDDLASLLGTFLAEARSGQEWSLVCRFLGGALGAEGVQCLVWEDEHLCLKGTSGRFPEDLLSDGQKSALAGLATMASSEVDADGRSFRISSLPIRVEDGKVAFLAYHSEKIDSLLRCQEVLPVLYVLCRLVVTWSEEARRKEFQVGALAERVREMEAQVVSSQDAAEPIVGRSAALLSELRTADKAAACESTVLIVGPTGSGKELFARRIHRLSKRAMGPFIAINCSSIPDTLLESELFGVARGAFTGAERSRPGFFRAANRGTLFLDEISDLPIQLQPKLLRVLEEGCFYPLGSTDAVSVDVRVLAATHQDPSTLIRSGRFREDLYYRLAGVVLKVPPLAERGEDIVLLAHYFLSMANREFQKNVAGIDEQAVAVLRSQGWPGNVRQLQSLVKQAVLFAEEPVITEEALTALLTRFHEASASSSHSLLQLPWAEACERFEENYFRHRLTNHQGTFANLARDIGITRPNLYVKKRKWNLGGEEEP